MDETSVSEADRPAWVSSTRRLTLKTAGLAADQLLVGVETTSDRPKLPSSHFMPRILIVDDDEAVLTTISVLLTTEGHTIATARDGLEATKRLRVEPFDLVLTDIVMPNCEGLETIVSLRRNFPDVAVIAMSGAGLGSDVYLAAGARLGAHCTLSKPFTSAELINAITVALRKRRLKAS